MAVDSSKIPEFLVGGGEMGELIRNFNWTTTSLGEPENWERSLKTCMRIMLTSSQPMWIGWGKELIKLYNDPYKAIVGGKHPDALGKPASIVWKDIWKDIEPMLKRVMEMDEGTYVESQLLIMQRNQYPEETYYTFSYTPIPGDFGGPAGMICANTDDTARIINERAMQTLQDLGKMSINENGATDIFSSAVEILGRNSKDFPFAMIYQVNAIAMTAAAVAWAGDKGDYTTFPDIINLKEQLEDTKSLCMAIKENKVIISENAGRKPNAPKGFWDIAPKEIIHVPIRTSSAGIPEAILTVGLNPYRKFDRPYQQFIQLITDQLIIEINNVEALEAQRKRNDALMEIDKAKTVFFNNISHEFRTPLTLILSPLEELLKQPVEEFNPQNHAHLVTMQRNSMRLLKLVNALLDFSRVESGREKARFVSTEINQYTQQLASNFTSIIENAGLKFNINIEKIDQLVYIDKTMWEKIVFNLISNAIKYTLRGTIQINLFCYKSEITLQVVDTGIGIPENELPHIFDRFYRVEGKSGRTFEGTGIGLSLIKELVLLHGGNIKVVSKEGVGTTFSVHIPTGSEHLPPDQIWNEQSLLKTESVANLYLEEVKGLIEKPRESSEIPNSASNTPNLSKSDSILIVDDNKDMREYIASLLSYKYDVHTATNGLHALEKIKNDPPSLVLSDIMMPVMDGVQLLKELKQDVRTLSLPVILLSARAGEESKIAGLSTGADDYLTKPFSANELIARIESQLKNVSIRKRSEEHLRNLFLQAPVAICIFKGLEFKVEVANERMLQLWDKKNEEVINRPIFTALPEAKGQGFEDLLRSVYTTGQRFVAAEAAVELIRYGKPEKIYVSFVFEPLYEDQNEVVGIMAVAHEITDLVLARHKVEESELRFKKVADTAPVLIWMTNSDEKASFFNKAWLDYTGHAMETDAGNNWSRDVYPDDLQPCMTVYHSAFEKRTEFYVEYRLRRYDGKFRWISSKGIPRFSAEGNFEGFIGACMDIHDQKTNSEQLELLVRKRTAEIEDKNVELAQKNKELQSFTYVAGHDMQEPLRKIQTLSSLFLEREGMNLTDSGLKSFNRIQDSVAKMQKLIVDLLEYSRTNNEGAAFESLDLNSLLAEIKDDLAELLSSQSALLVIGNTCKLKVIPFQIKQVINNLIGNSLKFSRQNVQPIIKIDSEIIVKGFPDKKGNMENKKYCHVTLQDNGIGFEAEYNERIFEVFQRLHNQSE